MKKVIFGDCFDYFSKINDKSIDLIFADLPYGITNCKWDTPINLPLLWKHYNRIIKDNGTILLFAQTPFDKVLGCSNLEMLRYEWIWEKTQATGHLNSKKMPLKAHENILVFYKKLPYFNPIKTKGHPPINKYTKYISTQNNTEIYGRVNIEISGGGETERFPRSVQIFSSDKQKNYLHPTQKPLRLIKYFIKSYTKKGNLVLDNVAGSGTVAVACELLGRQYIVIEKEKKYYNIILKRLKKLKSIKTKK